MISYRSKKVKGELAAPVRLDWRNSQKLYKRQVAGRRRVRRFLVFTLLSVMIFGVARFASYGLYASDYHFSRNDSDGPPVDHSENAVEYSSPVAGRDTDENRELLTKVDPRIKRERLQKRDLPAMFADTRFTNLRSQGFDATLGGQPVKVETSLDLSLQQYLVQQVSDSISLNTGIVVMEPATGRILAMVGFDKRQTGKNPCVDNSFPAASVFKIVTAGAAIETCGFDPNKELTFNGSKYTLYKSQVDERVTRNPNRVSFGDSFAQSINPVFGKIGSHQLGSKVLSRYAGAFGFNHSIEFDMELAPSELSVQNDPFRLAEIASGYNRDTSLSPVHGALIAASILNQGLMPVPSIVDRVVDQRGNPLYENRPASLGKPLTPAASQMIYQMMQGTVRAGTGRRAFQGVDHNGVLSRLIIGGKTGSMDNRTREARIDWFVGYAQEKNGTAALAFAVVVAHEKVMGTRAGQYARMAIEHYFRNHLSALRGTQPATKG